MAGVWSASHEFDALRTARERTATLALFHDVVEDAIGREWLGLLEALCEGANATVLAAQYGRVFCLLAEAEELSAEPPVGDAWQNHLLNRLLDSANPFSRKAERVAIEAIGPALIAQASRDLRALQALFVVDATQVCTALAAATGDTSWVPWIGFRPLEDGSAVEHSARQRTKHDLAAAPHWGAMVESLADYYRAAGAGDFGRYRAFRWTRRGGEGRLEGVATPDPIRLEDLVGYEREREPVVRNTLQFVAGSPANNVLLYGDQGTGKSSTVKALLHAYADRGLRLIEVAKEDLADFPRILALLRGRPERFILFVDDLSFEEQETHYKALKAILEGGLEARPDNVLLYATSNRRHLVKEHFGDRVAPGDDELHVQDTMEEKLSLAARFGLRVTFMAPSQERFLAIVESLAQKRGLAVPREEVRRRAIAWAQWQNGRSGRTARQFIDHLTGELALTGHHNPDGLTAR
ncbi:MAG: ATP-binding protein [Chloroflexi bacterium]|nr:ATP-binding protein [Chloroflexota bacterium]